MKSPWVIWQQTSTDPLRRIVLAAVVLGSIGLPSSALAQPSVATVQFGNSNAPGLDQNCFQGSATAPPEPCGNAFHKLIPGSVAIADEGTVNFQRNGFHQVLVFKPGTKPQDLVPANSRVVGTSPVLPCDGAACPTGIHAIRAQGSGGTQSVTFTEPGRYLVICNITTHFNQNMWGWVNVN